MWKKITFKRKVRFISPTGSREKGQWSPDDTLIRPQVCSKRIQIRGEDVWLRWTLRVERSQSEAQSDSLAVPNHSTPLMTSSKV